LRAADLYLRESKGEQALAELQQALALEPDNRFLLERAALAASMAQEPGPAEAFFRKLIELDPQAVSYRVGLAGVFFRLGRQAEAEEAVRQALQISPRDLPGRYTRVCVLVAQGRGDEAGSSWEALLTAEELDPVVNSVIADRENLRQALGDGGVSAVCGILLGPGTDGRLPEIAGALKDVRAAMGERRWADAEQALAAAWNLGVDRTALKLDLVRCRYEAGDPDTARDLMKDLIEKYPRYATLRFNYGFLLLRSASYAEAATAFEEGLKDAPEDRQMAFALACSLAGQGMTDSAWPILTNLAQVAGSQLTRWLASDAPYVLAIREDERYDRLLAGVRRQPAPAPRPPSGDALRRMRAADRFIQEQNWEHALAELEEGLRLDPEHSSLLRKAAVVAAILRKDTVAEDHFRRFLDLDPDNVPHLSGWAAVLIRMGRLDDADAALRRALALAPRDLASRFLMTCADLARGRALTAGKEWLFVSTDEMESIAGWMLADEDDLRRTLGDGGFAKLCDLALGPGAAARLSDVAAVLRDIRQGMAAGDWEDVDTAIEGARAMGLHETAVQSALGRARFQAGDHEAALEILRDLAGKNPGVLSAQFNYGFVLVKTGDFEQAASVYERAHGMDPANTQVAFGLACAHAGRGDLDRAWPLLEELVRVGERNLMGWLEGDEPYLRAIRGDARYPALVAKLVASGESRR
jgi:tetratricopeptide (TPR) repeat protein